MGLSGRGFAGMFGAVAGPGRAALPGMRIPGGTVREGDVSAPRDPDAPAAGGVGGFLAPLLARARARAAGMGAARPGAVTKKPTPRLGTTRTRLALSAPKTPALDGGGY